MGRACRYVDGWIIAKSATGVGAGADSVQLHGDGFKGPLKCFECPPGSPDSCGTEAPTEAPTNAPTDVPTDAPTNAPTEAPTNAPTEAPTDKGTPLLIAARRADTAVVRALLSAGARVDAVNQISETALHLAASKGLRAAT